MKRLGPEWRRPESEQSSGNPVADRLRRAFAREPRYDPVLPATAPTIEPPPMRRQFAYLDFIPGARLRPGLFDRPHWTLMTQPDDRCRCPGCGLVFRPTRVGRMP